jgi:hypothetical protein
MQNHTKVYMKFFGYGEQDFIPCEMCGSRAVDIHHIEKRNKTKNDYIENLIALCRDCHINAESDTSFNSYCRIQHLELVCRYIYALIDLNKKLNENRKQIN